jgi:hypothetical protein
LRRRSRRWMCVQPSHLDAGHPQAAVLQEAVDRRCGSSSSRKRPEGVGGAFHRGRRSRKPKSWLSQANRRCRDQRPDTPQTPQSALGCAALTLASLPPCSQGLVVPCRRTHGYQLCICVNRETGPRQGEGVGCPISALDSTRRSRRRIQTVVPAPAVTLGAGRLVCPPCARATRSASIRPKPSGRA